MHGLMVSASVIVHLVLSKTAQLTCVWQCKHICVHTSSSDAAVFFYIEFAFGHQYHSVYQLLQ